MNKVLLGDCNPATLYRQLTKQELNYPGILQNEKQLTNLYLHQLKDGAAMLRTPTGLCTRERLADQGLDDRMEAIVNVCISTAKQAIQAVAADALLAGVVGPVSGGVVENEVEAAKQISELVIYLADFGVDIIVVEGIRDWDSFEMTIALIRKLSGVPIAPFFNCRSVNSALVAAYASLSQDFELELAGFELDLSQGVQAAFPDIPSGIPIGLMLSAEQANHTPDEADISRLASALRPTLIAGGDGVDRAQWQGIKHIISNQQT